MLESMEGLYDKLKHLSIVQADLVSKLVPHKMKNLLTLIDPSDEAKFVSTLETVRHQTQIVSQWINNSKMFQNREDTSSPKSSLERKP